MIFVPWIQLRETGSLDKMKENITHRSPSANTEPRAILCLLGTFSFHTIGIGRHQIKISDRMLTAYIVVTAACLLPHRPGTRYFQNFHMGEQIKRPSKTETTACAMQNPITIRAAILNLRTKKSRINMTQMLHLVRASRMGKSSHSAKICCDTGQHVVPGCWDRNGEGSTHSKESFGINGAHVP